MTPLPRACSLCLALAAVFGHGAVPAQEAQSAMVAPAGRLAPQQTPGAGAALDPREERSAAPAETAPEAKHPGDSLETRLAHQLGRAFTIRRYGGFVLATDIDDPAEREHILRTLRACRRALRRDYFDRAPRESIAIYAFRDTESYSRHLRDLWNETPISPYGHYNYARKEIVFNASTGLGTLVHELVHALVDADLPGAPIWLDEGLASLYEECVIENGTIRGSNNWRLPELRARLDEPAYTPLATLLALDEAAFRRGESLHYAEARYLFLYLEERRLLRPFYRAFRDAGGRCAPAEILEALCGAPLDRIEAEWRAWIRRQPLPAGWE